VLGNQPAVEPFAGGGDGEKLSASVAKHLKRYFDLHGGAAAPGRLPAHPARGGDCR
jgi:two-component system, NtrC family, nitrogen regulation response regulator GlnG